MKYSPVYFILGVILSISALIRFPGLDKFPPGVTPDEIQQGYSAYSILKTGKDEWGDFLSIYPRSFGDYRPPLYTYLTVPSVALLGLNIVSIRLPSAIFGTLAILVVFFLAKEIFDDEKIGLLSALLTAISYWHIFYSRAAWESNAGAVLILAGILFFLKGLKNKKNLIYSAVFFGLSLFSYYSFKILTPLFVAGLVSSYFNQIIRIDRKWIVSALAIFLLFTFLMGLGDVISGGGRRASDAAIYNSENLLALRNTQVEDKLPQPWGRVINNRLSYLASQFTQNYLGYFSTTFWISPNRPDSSLYNMPGEWLLSAWEAFFILFGLIIIIRRTPNFTKLVLLWALITPIPAALTRDYMHTQRVETLLFLAPFLTAFGIFSAYSFLKNNKLRFYFVVILAGWMLFSFVTRLDHYFFHQFNRGLGGEHYGYNRIVEFTDKNKDRFDRIIFTKQNSEPQIFVAFYSKIEPNIYQENAQNWKYFENAGFKFLDMINFNLGKYYFKNIEWDKDRLNKNSLIVGVGQDFPPEVKSVYEVKDPFGKVIFKAVDTNFEPKDEE